MRCLPLLAWLLAQAHHQALRLLDCQPLDFQLLVRLWLHHQLQRLRPRLLQPQPPLPQQQQLLPQQRNICLGHSIQWAPMLLQPNWCQMTLL